MSSLAKERRPFSVKYPDGSILSGLKEEEIEVLTIKWERDEKIFSKRK